MQRIDLNKNWSFYESNESMSFVFYHPEGRTVDLPHDFIITKPRSAAAEGGPGNGFFGHGEGVYKKLLDIPTEWEGKTVLLDIDGAYMNTEVALNGELLALHPYGYTPFQVDLSQALRYHGKKNELKILTQSRQPSSRWYSGGGIYRSVSLWVGNSVHMKPWDVFVTTPMVNDQEARVCFQSIVSNEEDRSRSCVLVHEVLDADQRQVAVTQRSVLLEARTCVPATVEAFVEQPKRWDLETPYLYTYRVSIYEDSSDSTDANSDKNSDENSSENSGENSDKEQVLLDVAEGQFGIRSIAVDTEHGFMLNGRTVKLQGGCLHHDNGFLGACAYPKAEERKIRILKAAGYNAVRISHNPPSLAMLQACDRLGMLLLDECFDVWRMGKTPLDYHLYFEDWWERDIELMVKRDRNHPCVITYSIGNEIGERDGKNQGALWSRKLSDKIRSIDSTRFVLSALCQIFDDDAELGTNFDANLKEETEDTWGPATKAYAEPLDIVGYNYLHKRYEKDHETYPNRVIAGTESHALTTYDYWEGVKKNSHVIGDFIWAAVDYLGEVGTGKVFWASEQEPFHFFGPYPWRSSWQSDIMLTGRRRPQSYYREIMWGHSENTCLFTIHPKHYGDHSFGMDWRWHEVNDDWSFGDEFLGKRVTVQAYGPGEEAEFILNGTSLGRVPYEKLIASMDIPYEKGTLEAVSYQAGEEISRGKLFTVGIATQILLTPEEDSIRADGADLCYIHIDITDENGIRIPMDDRLIKVDVTGTGQFLAVGSGSPCSEDQIGDPTCHVYQGAAVIIIKALQPGIITVTVTADLVMTGSCMIKAVETML